MGTGEKKAIGTYAGRRLVLETRPSVIRARVFIIFPNIFSIRLSDFYGP